MSFLSGLFGRKYASIGPTEARRRVDGGAVLLDVREPSEWRAGHAPKARHIPLNDLDRRRRGAPGRPGDHHGVPVREPIRPRRRDSRRRRARRAEPVRRDAGLVGRRPPGRRQGRTARVRHLMRTLAAAALPLGAAACPPTRPRGSASWRGPVRGAVPAVLIVAIPVGLLIGLSLGALGGGGSILTVPALVYLLGMDTRAATTGSLIIVGVTAVFGMLAHRRDGHVRVLQGVVFGALGAAGAVAGTRLSLAVPPDVLLAGFSVLMLAVAALMLTRAAAGCPAGGGPGVADAGAVGRADHHLHPPVRLRLPPRREGARRRGGGRVDDRVLRRRRRVPGGPGAGAGPGLPDAGRGRHLAAGHRHQQRHVAGRPRGGGIDIDWTVIGVFTAAAVIGSLLGARIATRARPETLRIAFAVLIIAVGLYTAARSIPALFG